MSVHVINNKIIKNILSKYEILTDGITWFYRDKYTDIYWNVDTNKIDILSIANKEFKKEMKTAIREHSVLNDDMNIPILQEHLKVYSLIPVKSPKDKSGKPGQINRKCLTFLSKLKEYCKKTKTIKTNIDSNMKLIPVSELTLYNIEIGKYVVPDKSYNLSFKFMNFKFDTEETKKYYLMFVRYIFNKENVHIFNVFIKNIFDNAPNVMVIERYEPFILNFILKFMGDRCDIYEDYPAAYKFIKSYNTNLIIIKQKEYKAPNKLFMDTLGNISLLIITEREKINLGKVDYPYISQSGKLNKAEDIMKPKLKKKIIKEFKPYFEIEGLPLKYDKLSSSVFKYIISE